MDKITLSDSFFSLDYLRYVVTKSDEGESVILIYFQFENKSGKTARLFNSIELLAFQHGIELDGIYIEKDIPCLNFHKSILTGYSMTIAAPYKLTDFGDVTLTARSYESDLAASQVLKLSAGNSSPKSPDKFPLSEHNTEFPEYIRLQAEKAVGKPLPRDAVQSLDMKSLHYSYAKTHPKGARRVYYRPKINWIDRDFFSFILGYLLAQHLFEDSNESDIFETAVSESHGYEEPYTEEWNEEGMEELEDMEDFEELESEDMEELDFDEFDENKWESDEESFDEELGDDWDNDSTDSLDAEFTDSDAFDEFSDSGDFNGFGDMPD